MRIPVGCIFSAMWRPRAEFCVNDEVQLRVRVVGILEFRLLCMHRHRHLSPTVGAHVRLPEGMRRSPQSARDRLRGNLRTVTVVTTNRMQSTPKLSIQSKMFTSSSPVTVYTALQIVNKHKLYIDAYAGIRRTPNNNEGVGKTWQMTVAMRK
jgi:hypothetical protein